MGKLGPSTLIFQKLLNSIILTNGALNLLSTMGSISSFGLPVQEILLNNYLKINFENAEIRDSVLEILSGLGFHKGKILLTK